MVEILRLTLGLTLLISPISYLRGLKRQPTACSRTEE